MHVRVAIEDESHDSCRRFRAGSLTRALNQFQEHYLFERNHQGKGNILLFPKADQLPTSNGPSIECQKRPGGLLRCYYRWAG